MTLYNANLIDANGNNNLDFNPVGNDLNFVKRLMQGRMPLYNNEMASPVHNDLAAVRQPITYPDGAPQDNNIFERYRQSLENYPKIYAPNNDVVYKPSTGRRLLSFLTNRGYGPAAVQQAEYAPYFRQLQNYRLQTGALGGEAKLEAEQRAARYAEYLKLSQAQQAQKHGQLYDYQRSPEYMKGRFGYKPQNLQELEDVAGFNHPQKNVIRQIKQQDGQYHDLMFTPNGEFVKDLGQSKQLTDPQALEELRQRNRMALEMQREKGRKSLEEQRRSEATKKKNLLPSQQKIALQLRAQEYLRNNPDLQDKIVYNPDLGMFQAKSATHYLDPTTWGTKYTDEANKANELLTTPSGVSEVEHKTSTAFRGFIPESERTTRNKIKEENKIRKSSKYQRVY